MPQEVPASYFQGLEENFVPLQIWKIHCLRNVTIEDTAAELQGRGWIPFGFSIPFWTFYPHPPFFLSAPWSLAEVAVNVSMTKLPGLWAGGGRCVPNKMGLAGCKCVWLAQCFTKGESPASQDKDISIVFEWRVRSWGKEKNSMNFWCLQSGQVSWPV